MFNPPALPPGPRTLLQLREVFALKRDVIEFFSNSAATHGDLFCFRIGTQLIYVVNHPDLIQETLVTNQKSLQKTWILGNVTEGLGQGMLTSTGDFHRRQRKLIQPALHSQRVRGYSKTIIQLADRSANSFSEGDTVDMSETMRLLTLSVVAQTLFGSDIAEDADEVGRAITELTKAFLRAKSPFGEVLNRVPFLPSNRRFDRAKARLDETIYRLIEQRRLSGESRDDLLSMLLSSRYEDGSLMSDQLVRDEAVALFLAGHETTSISLAWVWFVLSQHPEIEARFHDELDSVLGGRLPEPDDLERLPFVRKVIAETIRLYPAIYVVPRRAIAPCQVDGYTIRNGALVLVNIYNVHRDPRWYENPELFDPERWTQEMKDGLPRYAYCPFGAGPHSCLGQAFAWTEAMLVMSVLAQRWKARVVPGHTVGLNALVNLRPRGGMPMILSSR
jgi:cytochrome P450